MEKIIVYHQNEKIAEMQYVQTSDCVMVYKIIISKPHSNVDTYEMLLKKFIKNEVPLLFYNENDEKYAKRLGFKKDKKTKYYVYAKKETSTNQTKPK